MIKSIKKQKVDDLSIWCALIILLTIGLQSFINIAVTVNVLPNTGIGLPFISYGGTAVFCQLFEMAIVLSVCRRIQKKGEKSNDK